MVFNFIVTVSINCENGVEACIANPSLRLFNESKIMFA